MCLTQTCTGSLSMPHFFIEKILYWLIKITEIYTRISLWSIHICIFFSSRFPCFSMKSNKPKTLLVHPSEFLFLSHFGQHHPPISKMASVSLQIYFSFVVLSCITVLTPPASLQFAQNKSCNSVSSFLYLRKSKSLFPGWAKPFFPHSDQRHHFPFLVDQLQYPNWHHLFIFLHDPSHSIKYQSLVSFSIKK